MRQDNGERCENCAYFAGFSNDNRGYCRRHTPQVNMSGREWPVPDSCEWCGEWKHDGVPRPGEDRVVE